MEFDAFVSHRRLVGRSLRGLRKARRRFAIDSGGFTEVSQFGGWRTTPEDYVTSVRAYTARLGRPDFIAPQDWMCEPFIIRRTGLSVAEHQRRTVANYLRLRELAPDLPIIPVVQGWQLGDYLRCVDLYARAGVDLADAPLVGLGSVCRRQSTDEIAQVVTTLAAGGLGLHGFGVKTAGLALYGDHLVSADSMAWSFRARRSPALPGCVTHRNCANCPRYAAQWRDNVLTGLRHRQTRPWQMSFLDLPNQGVAR
uniref:deazapurine DNA modification protein DpdA family protein n=1 Tax=Actinokineospora pegani TaxID=2654637 RepID=UPI0018D4653D|nr:hypothetical protein [Actinokineospora pegani]